MKTASALASLERQIALHGQLVVLKRGAATLNVMAVVRGAQPDELVGGIQQNDTNVILSPRSLVGTAFGNGVQLGDLITAAGRLQRVMAVDQVAFGTTPVRINLQVRG